MLAIKGARDVLGAIRGTAGRLRESLLDVLHPPAEQLVRLPEPPPGIFSPGPPTVTWKRLRTRHGEVFIAQEPLKKHDILIGHAEIGDRVVGFVETPYTYNESVRRHWAIGVDSDGVSMAHSYRVEPLVPGVPMASGKDILRHLSTMRKGPRAEIPDLVSVASQFVDGDEMRGEVLVVQTQKFMKTQDFGGSLLIQEAVMHVVARIVEKLGRTRLLTPRNTGSWTAISDAFTAPKEKVEALERFLKARPWLHGMAAISTWVDFEGTAEEVERRLGREHWISDATMRRLGPEVGDVNSRVLDVLKSLPVDWIPSRGNVEEWTAFRAMCETLAGAPDLRHAFPSLLAGAKGRWVPFMDRVARECGLAGPAFLGEWRKAIEAEVETHSRLKDPSPDWHGARFRPMAALSDVADMIRALDADLEAILGGTHARRITTYHMASEAIVGKRGLASLLEASRKWHVDPSFKATALSRAELRWDPNLPEWTDPKTGIRIVPLGSSHDLVHEGARGADPSGMAGLDHCVGSDSYVLAAARGESAILSLRRDGQRLSTAEIALKEFSGLIHEHEELLVHRTGFVLQHRARRNGEPTGAAKSALLDYLGLPEVTFAITEARYREAELPPALDRGTPMQILDPWRPYLTGKCKSASPEDFAETLRVAP